MPRNVSTVTRKGQVTIPIEIRRRLGIHEGDQIEFSAVDNVVHIKPIGNGSTKTSLDYPNGSAESVVDQLAGILSDYAMPWLSEEERHRAEEAAIVEGWTERERRFQAQRARSDE